MASWKRQWLPRFVTAAGLMATLTASTAVGATGDVLLRTGSEPAALCVTTADTVSIDLQVANLSDAINGVQVLIHYDASVLSLDPISTSERPGWLRVALIDDGGDVAYAIINVVEPVGPGAGPFTVATLGFDTVAENSTTAGFRPDDPPFRTKLVVAGDSSVILPGTFDSGPISIDDTVAAASSNSPVCEGDTIELYGGPDNGPVAPYDYAWTGPNGFGSSDQNPTIEGAPLAAAGTYALTVTNAAGCSLGPVSTDVAVQAAPTADAGPDQQVCDTETVSVSGTAAHASSTLWATSGDGSFDDPAAPDAVYTPGPSDLAAGTVTLTFTANPTAPCSIAASDQMIVTFQASPTADAGLDETICASKSVALDGSATHASGTLWTTAGDGSFDDPGRLDTVYTPGVNDALNGGVVLTLEADGIGPCTGSASDMMTVTIQPCIFVVVEIDGLTEDIVDRDVTFVVTTCPDVSEAYGETVTFTPDVGNGVGVGAATLRNIRADAEWLAVHEGHTLRRLVGVDLSATHASTVGVTLLPGDFHTATVAQDNLVDIVDFAILAARWESDVDDCAPGPPDPEDCGMGADVDGDGYQNADDFAVMQPNFFLVGDAADGCLSPLGGAGDNVGLAHPSLTLRSGIPLTELRRRLPHAARADLNHDGVVDTRDIRAFANRHDLPMSAEFKARLSELEAERVGLSATSLRVD